MRPLRTARVLFAAAIVAVAVLSTGGASAIENETFGITPYPEDVSGSARGSFQIPLEPGQTFEDAVQIYNRTDQKLDLAVYAADGDAGPDETDISDISVGFRNQQPKGVGSWIDLARETVELAPRDEVIITFRVEVKNADPSPAYGAIVVENTARGLEGNSSKREFITVRTVPPNTETASRRVRPFLLQSPWIVVAIAGLLVAAALVIIGARRSRRPKDVLVPAGEIEQPQLDPDDPPEASRPVIKRLGETDEDDRTSVLIRMRSKPLVEDAFLVEVDPDEDDEEHTDEDDDDFEDDDFEDEDDLPPAKPRPARKKPVAKAKPKPKPKPVTRKPAPKKVAKKPVAKKAKPKPKARAKAKPKPKPNLKPEPGYIPLEEL